MAQAVRDKLDQFLRFLKEFQDFLGYCDVLKLVTAPYIVNITQFPHPHHSANGPAVVFHKKPVAHIGSLSIKGKFLILQGIGHEERNEFFRILIRPEIVARPDDNDRQTVGHMIGLSQMVSPGLACRIGGRGG